MEKLIVTMRNAISQGAIKFAETNLFPCRKQKAPLKCWLVSIRLYGAKSHKTTIFNYKHGDDANIYSRQVDL